MKKLKSEDLVYVSELSCSFSHACREGVPKELLMLADQSKAIYLYVIWQTPLFRETHVSRLYK